MNWILAILLILILWSFIERRFLGVSKYYLTSSKHDTNKDPIHIVVLADLHNNTFGKKNGRMIRRIDSLKPDILLLAGDIITKRKPCYPSHAFDLLEQLSQKYPIYYAYGNHELYYDRMTKLSNEVNKKTEVVALLKSWEFYLERIQQLGVKVLTNESNSLMVKNQKMCITGLSLGPEFYPKGKIKQIETMDLNRLLGRCSEDYQILIAHNPVFFDKYAKWGADLTVAGHLHGGLARIPFLGGVISPQYKFFPRYDAGKFTMEDKHMVVSRGLGSHSIMMRLFNPPDLVSIRLISRNSIEE